MRTINYYMTEDQRLIRVVIVDGVMDEVAELECLSTVEEGDDEEAEEEIEEEEAPVPRKASKPKAEGKRFETKSCCGSKGARHMKDCPTNKTVDKSEPDEERPYIMSHGVLSTHQQKINQMLKDEGKSEEQVYNAMYQEMTNEEIRKAIEHARA